MIHSIARFVFVSIFCSIGCQLALAQDNPDCTTTTITICADQETLEALGMCDGVVVQPRGLTVDCDDVCLTGIGCCDVEIEIGPVDGCPDDPEPCPHDLASLIQKVEDNVVWDQFDTDANKLPVVTEILESMVKCCSDDDFFGLDLQDAVDAYKYFFPDTGLSDSVIEDMFADAAGDGNCDKGPGPPHGPPDEPGWPNDVIPTDGPPIDGDNIGPQPSNRGGRCEGIGLTGGPNFENYSTDPAECAGGSSIGIYDIDMFSRNWAKQALHY